MTLKNIFLAGTILAAAWYVFWLWGYTDLSSMNELSRQNYALITNIKLLIVLAFYIAWRVTPEAK